MFRLLEDKTVNLRVVEKEDLAFLAEWYNKLELSGEYNPLWQVSRTEIEKNYVEKSLKKPTFSLKGKMEVESVTCGIST